MKGKGRKLGIPSKVAPPPPEKNVEALKTVVSEFNPLPPSEIDERIYFGRMSEKVHYIPPFHWCLISSRIWITSCFFLFQDIAKWLKILLK
jgi:hypothetical protein